MKAMKRLLCLVLTCCFVLVFFGSSSVPSASANDELQEAIDRKNELQQQLDELNAKLDDLKDEVDLQQQRKDTYAERRAIVEEQIQTLQTSITIKNTELAVKQQELDAKQRELNQNYELFKQRMRAMYMNRNLSTLSILVGANSFSEFLMGTEALKRISRHDTDLIETITIERDIIETENAIIETELVSLQNDEAELDSKHNELAQLYMEADSSLTYAQAMQTATEEDYSAILAEFMAQNAEIDRLMGVESEIEYVGGYFAWPVPGYTYISSYYGWRTLYGQPNFHTGIDIAGGGIHGKPVIASNHGVVANTIYGSTGYGLYVIVDHGGGWKTLYAHLSAIYVYEGQTVTQGTYIGAVGTTGNSTGPHLHFEIRKNGERMDPLQVSAFVRP